MGDQDGATLMDAIDKIIQILAGQEMEMTREQVLKRSERTGKSPETWLAQLEQAAREIKDPEYMKADPTGVVDMEKFSAPLNAHLVKGNSRD
jgi:hypothetical protein